MRPAPENPPPVHRAIRLLIVDDNSQVRQDLRILLDLSRDLDVVGEAGSGQEAILLAETLQPEAILMDLEMPGLDGYTAARQIKARCPTYRLLAFSVHSYPQARQKAQESGMDGFIEKGASLESIVEILSSPPPGRSRNSHGQGNTAHHR
jgi:DNA-binding NarL/FixJ family response regulator